VMHLRRRVMDAIAVTANDATQRSNSGEVALF